MHRLTIAVGLTLIVLGLAFFASVSTHAPTALIPSGFGLVLLVLGILATNEELRMHAMHGALGIALIGAIGTLHGLFSFLRWIAGQDIRRPAAAAEKAGMCLVLLVFLILGLRSFIKVRLERARRAIPQTEK